MESQTIECSLCGISLCGITNYQKHVNSLEHANKIHLKSSQNITDEDKVYSNGGVAFEPQVRDCKDDIKRVDNIGSFFCELCQKPLSGMEPYRQHMEGAGHKKKMALQLCLNQSNPLELMRCTTCDKSFSGPIPYEQHMSSSVHKKKVLEKELMKKGNLFSSLNDSCETNGKCNVTRNLPDAEPLESSSQMDTSVQGTVVGWKCIVCDKYFTGPIPYDQHLSSNLHIKKVRDEEFRCQNKIDTAESSVCNSRSEVSSICFPGLKPSNQNSFVSMLRCETCDKSFSGPVPYDQHMNSMVHKKKIQEKDLIKKICSTDTIYEAESTTSDEKMNTLSNNFQEPYQQQLSAMQIGSMQYKCEMCDKTFSGPVPFEQHKSSNNHQKKMLQKMPQINSEQKNTSPILSQDNISKNGASTSHSWYCGICQKQCSGPVPYNQHIISDVHCKKICLIEMQNSLKGSENFNSPKPSSSLITENINQVSDNEDNSLKPTVKNETNQICQGAQQSTNSDFIYDNVFNLNYNTPENLNVTTFKPEDDIVFDASLK